MPSVHSTRFAVLLMVSVIGVLVFISATSIMLTQAGIHGQLYRQILDAQDLRSAIEPPPLYLVEAMLTAHEVVDADDVPTQIARLTDLIGDFKSQEVAWRQRLGKTEPGPDLTLLTAPAHEFMKVAEQQFIPTAQRGERAAAKAILEGPMTIAFKAHHQQVLALMEHLKRLKRDAENQAGTLQYIGSVGIALTLLVVFGASWGLYRVRAAHQQEIRQGEERMRLLNEAAFEGIAVTDGTKIITANQPLAVLLGMPDVQRLVGESLLRFISPDQHSRFLSALAHKQEDDHELTLVRTDGTTVDIEMRLRNFVEDGKVIRQVVFRDVTFHKKSQRDLLAFQQQLQELVELRSRELSLERDRLNSYINVTSVLMVVLDLDGNIVRINPYGCELLGLPMAEVVGRKWLATCLSSEQHTSIYQHFLSYVRAPHQSDAEAFVTQAFEQNITCRNGKERRLLFRNAWLRDANEQINGLVSSAVDVTAAYAAELALRQAKDDAERSNRAKSDFLANMSHEIRTPLNAVLGYAQLLKRDERLDPRHQRAVDVIGRSGEHLLSLISDILEMSRIESGRLTCELVSCDLFDLLDGLRSLFLLRARDKGLELRLTLAPDLPKYVLTDAQKLRQILTNLIGNAVKFTATGEIEVRAAIIDGWLHATVIDCGVGIDAEELPQLFKPFVQVTAGRVRGDGTGLGLAISRGLAEALGGSLTACSTLGRGSEFTLAIPAPMCADAEPSPMSSTQVLGLIPGSAIPRVLIAEDHTDNRLLLHELMETVGFEVRSVGDGAAALASCTAWQPHLVWMDIDMPIMDGLSATKAIRAAQTDHRPVIIALTAAAFSEDRQRILASGCDEVAHKPYSEEVLFSLMERLMGIAFLRREEPQHRASTDASTQSEFDDLRARLGQSPLPEREALHQALILGDLAAIADQCALWHDRTAAAAVLDLVKKMDLDRLMRLMPHPDPAAATGSPS